MAEPTYTPVKSSNIEAVAHHDGALYVRFLNGTVYRYPTAAKSLHDGMLASDSPGSYFHHIIKFNHKGEKV